MRFHISRGAISLQVALALTLLAATPAGADSRATTKKYWRGSQYACIYGESASLLEIGQEKSQIKPTSEIKRRLRKERRGSVRAATRLLRKLRSCSEMGAQAEQEGGVVTQAMGGGGNACATAPQIQQVLPSTHIQSQGNPVQIGLVGTEYMNSNRMVLALSTNGSASQAHPYSITFLPTASGQSGVLRSFLGGQSASYRLTLLTPDPSGSFYCRSNMVEVVVESPSACLPCGYPFTNTPGCEGGDIIFAHDGYLDPDDGAALRTMLAILLATENTHRLKHLHVGNPPGVFSQMLHDRMLHIGSQANLYGYHREVFDAKFDRTRTLQDMVAALARANPCNPVYIIAAGPFQIIYDALELLRDVVNPLALPHVKIVNHSVWNGAAGGQLGYKTQADVEADFPMVRIHMVPDGNQTAYNEAGNMAGFEQYPLLALIKASALETQQFGNNWHVNDLSDAQALSVLLTGILHPTIAQFHGIIAPLME